MKETGEESEYPALKDYVVNICDACYRFEGEMCHTPGCIFIRRTMEEVREYLDMMLIRPKVDGEYLRVGTTVEQWQEAVAHWQGEAAEQPVK